uniref:Reverse transcriptase domain-containing protein n=1 Tax=Tanacetum cinerariifolium TaxID=118510 RepID=A0A699I1W5_TANCI|nr:reverse transcriptase domain-containing protein [Tanacetum cinerariifolium]
MNIASSSGTGSLPSNIVLNPWEDLKVITTRSGVTLAGPSVSPPPLSKEVDREPETITNQVLTGSTNNVPLMVVQPSLTSNSFSTISSSKMPEVTNDTVQPSNENIQPPVAQTQNLVYEPVVAPKPKPTIPYPSRVNKQKLREKDDNLSLKFVEIFRNLHFELSFADALLYMPKFSLMFKSLLKNKEKLFNLAMTLMNENCLAVILKKFPEKLGDPGKFLIPCDFPEFNECLALVDLGVSINLMPLSIWKKLSLPELTSTQMIFELADRSTTRPAGIAEDVFVKVGKFHFITDFVVIDYVVDPRVPSILGRPFLWIERALIDVYGEELTLRVDDEAITFKVGQTSKYYYNDIESMSSTPWVSLVHCVPKKGGITVVKNKNTRLVTGWCVCIDYLKLNDATRKDHFPLPFIDQMLERLAGNEFYCFLDGFFGYFQIPIDPQDQEKTTFTYPYETFAYRIMSFGLCNAPGTFQRCMMAIFHDMIEKTMEVFMDDFLVFGDSFSSCLSHLDTMLQWCKDTNLVLNWEKCHFMVKGGIVLGHKIFKNRLEFDRAKFDVIAKLLYPTTVGVRSFLGHAGFYRRFIQDFSKIARPMTHLLEKETPFVFSKDCIDAFKNLKKKLRS